MISGGAWRLVTATLTATSADDACRGRRLIGVLALGQHAAQSVDGLALEAESNVGVDAGGDRRHPPFPPAPRTGGLTVLHTHWQKHAEPLNISREQYLRDSKEWAEQLAQPGGKKGYDARGQRDEDGNWAVKYSDPGGGKGGIVAPDGKVLSFWYTDAH